MTYHTSFATGFSAIIALLALITAALPLLRDRTTNTAVPKELAPAA